MRTTLDFRIPLLVALILFAAVIGAMIYRCSRGDVIEIARDNGLVVTGKVTCHLTPLNTPFFYCNKGMYIFSVPTDKGVLYYRPGWPPGAILDTPNGEVTIR